MVDFKIKRGLSTTMFTAPGVINPRLVIEEGVWYLCVDTAWLFLGVSTEEGSLTLKRINEVEADIALQESVKELRENLTALEELELFKKIDAESELPTDFDSGDFNPNITYYIPLANNRVSTYIFDKGLGDYVCTNSIDDVVVRAMVVDAIELTLEETLAAKLPEMVKDVVTESILYGGDATPEDD